MEPSMIYSGNHLFHYTKFESALKIIITGSLKFGDFKNMNDIAEAYREVFGMAEDSIINRVLAEYQSICLTLDKPSRRGFSIDSLWGHYAQKGYGICLVFDKKKLKEQLKAQFGRNAMMAKINYVSYHVGTVFTDGYTEDEVRRYVKGNIKKLFFTKSKDWKYEDEFRIVKTNKSNKDYLLYGNSLIAAILCLPMIEEYNDFKESSEFKILKAILPNKPILRYTTKLGNKELLNEDGERTCGVIGIDCQIDI